MTNRSIKNINDVRYAISVNKINKSCRSSNQLEDISLPARSRAKDKIPRTRRETRIPPQAGLLEHGVEGTEAYRLVEVSYGCWPRPIASQ